MIASEDTSKIIPALVKALGGMEDIARTRTAEIPTKSGGKFTYEYADLHDVLAYLRPRLAEHGLAVTQSAFTLDGNTAVSSTLLHESGQWIESPPLRLPAGSDAQAHGSSISYSRRYSLLALLGLATEDDDGAAASRPQRQSQPRQQTPRPQQAPRAEVGSRAQQGPSEAQLKMVHALMRGQQLESDDDRHAYATATLGRTVVTLTDLSREETSRLIDALKASAA